MDYSYVNDRTLRISLTFADLDAHDVKLIDFLSEQEKVEEFFYELIDELDIADRWSDTNLMTFQIRPNAKGIDILVSDEFSENFTENPEAAADLEEFLRQASGHSDMIFHDSDLFGEHYLEDDLAFSNQGKKGSSDKKDKDQGPEPDFIYYTIKFDDFNDLINLSKNVQADIDESELYEFQNSYYLTILDNQKLRGKKGTMNVRAHMLEYGEQGLINRELLREHAHVIIDHAALQTLKKI